MYSPHQGPPAHHVQPSHTSAFWSMKPSMSSSASSPICVPPLPIESPATANSPSNARYPCDRHHCVNPARRCEPIVEPATAELVPDESASRYWCTSKAKCWPGSTMFGIATAFGVPYQLSDQLCAPAQALPGTRIRFCAPAARTAAIAALAAATHCSVGRSCGSFISPKITRGSFLYCAASRDQKSANAEFGSEPLPTTAP